MLRGQEVAALEIGETRKEAKACQRGISVEVNRGPVSSDLLAFT
jgi:hypothetical protein